MNKKHFKNQTIKLVRALPQHPKVLSDFTWFVSMLFSKCGCRLPIVYVPPEVDVGVGLYSRHNLHRTDHTERNIFPFLLVDNWRFTFFSFKLIFDVVACKDRMYFDIYLSAEITKLLA